MRKLFFISLLLITNFVFSQGGYSPISKLRLTTTPVESNSNTQILVRDGSSGNVNYVKKDSLVGDLDKVLTKGNESTQSLSVGGVGINTTSPEAILDVVSTESGVLIPRLTTAQRDAIVSPINSMLIFNSDSEIFEYYFDGDWFGVGVQTLQQVRDIDPNVIFENPNDENNTATWNSVQYDEGIGEISEALSIDLDNEIETRKSLRQLFINTSNLYNSILDKTTNIFKETFVGAENGKLFIFERIRNTLTSIQGSHKIELDPAIGVEVVFKTPNDETAGTKLLATREWVQNDYGKLISLTTTEILAIVSPEVGRLYYNSTLNEVVFYDGTVWKKLSHSNM